MFSKARIRRFNEEVTCAPPPTKYAPKSFDSPVAHSMDKSDRWNGKTESTPGPTAYLGHVFSDDTASQNSSSSSISGFLMPQKPSLARSKSRSSTKTMYSGLREKINALEEEKRIQKDKIIELEDRLKQLKTKEDSSASSSSDKTFCDTSTQVDFGVKSVFAETEPTDEPKDLSCRKKTKSSEAVSLSQEELQLLRDQIEHLTCLRDNLESSVLAKEEVISDLQMQIDLVVAEAEERHSEVRHYQREIMAVKKEYETLLAAHQEACHMSKNGIAERDVEIELLIDKISSLETQFEESDKRVADLEGEVEMARKVASDLQQEAELQLNEVFCLKASLSAKEYDLESKDDLINTLQDEAKQSSPQELLQMEENISTLKSALDKEEENTCQLEERVLQLMAEIQNRESEQKKSMLEKESEIEELSVKYSDALLEQESGKRLLTVTSEKLEKESLLLQATEREVEDLRAQLSQEKSNYASLESSSKEVTHKLVHIEDALACEEAESREIQRKLETVEEHLETAMQEKESLKSSNEGYTAQIAMLKIGMTKKSLAVEDMQKRIDDLREEKTALVEDKVLLKEERTLLKATLRLVESSLQEKGVMLQDLQKEFETGLQTITRLEVDLEEKRREEERIVMAFEEEKGLFFNQISLLENHLMEEREQRAMYKAKTIEMEDRANLMEEEKQKAVLSCQSQLKNEKALVQDLKAQLKSIERKYEGYEDQLINMQTSLTDKTEEVEKLNQTYQEQIQELNGNISTQKTDEIQNLHKNLEEKQEQLCSLEMRLQEMDQTVASLKEQLDTATSNENSLHESFNISRKEQEEKLLSIMAEHKTQVERLNSANEELQEEAVTWRSKFEHLEKIAEPFREQLEVYEMEKSALLCKSSAAEQEVKKLSNDYAKLLGHQNHKQKIQHVVHIKTENNQLKEKVLKQQTELEKYKKTIRRLEEKRGVEPPPLSRGRSFASSKSNLALDPENKENSTLGLEPHPSSSTPLRCTIIRDGVYASARTESLSSGKENPNSNFLFNR